MKRATAAHETRGSNKQHKRDDGTGGMDEHEKTATEQGYPQEHEFRKRNEETDKQHDHKRTAMNQSSPEGDGGRDTYKESSQEDEQHDISGPTAATEKQPVLSIMEKW